MPRPTRLVSDEGFQASSGEIISNIYEKLLIPDPQDPSRLQGELAKRWSVSDDGPARHGGLAERTAYAAVTRAA